MPQELLCVACRICTTYKNHSAGTAQGFSELVRYEQVKQTFLQSTDAVCLETFAADLNALENNVPLDQIAPSQTVVQLTRLGDRCRVSFLHRDQSTNHGPTSHKKEMLAWFSPPIWRYVLFISHRPIISGSLCLTPVFAPFPGK